MDCPSVMHAVVSLCSAPNCGKLVLCEVGLLSQGTDAGRLAERMWYVNVAWLAQRLIDWLTALATWYYHRKYGALASRLGGGVLPGDGRRGFVVIQIDGLAHQYLETALDMGAAPYLKRLVQREGFHLQSWRCGLPSSTPAVQAGIMFGNNWNIPSFRWYDKTTGQSIVCKVPTQLQRLQARLGVGRYGLLTGGSSYFNLFDGGARTSFMTLSALGRQHLFENVRGSFFFLLFVLSPRRALRTLWLATAEYGRDLWHRLHTPRDDAASRRWSRVRAALSAPLTTLLSPLPAVTLNIVFREIQTFAVGLDIYRGVPAIYTDYYGYDEQAHHHGPLSAEALHALRAIDDCIRQIDHVRRQFRHRRPYDLIILSDHGMSCCRPFQETYGLTLGEFVRDRVGRAEVDASSGSTSWTSLQDQGLLHELQLAEDNVSPRTQPLVRLLRRVMLKGITHDPELQHSYDLARRSDVVVRAAGSLAHIYFNVTPEQMDIGEIALLYPALLDALHSHPGIGLVLGRERDRAVAVTSHGVCRLHRLIDSGAMPYLKDPRTEIQQLERLVRFPSSGDLIVLGRWFADGSVVGFEDHRASHGGLGGPQDHAFFLAEPELTWDLAGVSNSTELHRFFVNWYGDAAARAAGHPNDLPRRSIDNTPPLR